MSANASDTNERDSFEKWYATKGFGFDLAFEYYYYLCADVQWMYIGWQARGELEAKKLEGYQARVRELEEVLKEAVPFIGWGYAPSGLADKCYELAHTTAPDTALQKALLEARIDEHDMPANGTRIAQLRAQLASLNETLGE